MFGRLLWKLLRGNRGRLAVAFVAIVSGATVISSLLNVRLDIQHKLTEDFRALGANLVISPGDGLPANTKGPGSPQLMSQSVVMSEVDRLRSPDVVAAAPYLYLVVRAKQTQVVLTGTWLDQAPKLDPTWKMQGSWIAARDDSAQCLVGRNVARQFRIRPGDEIDLAYLGRSAPLRVAGTIDAGGAEDDQIFVNLPVAQRLANLEGQIELAQLSVRGTAASIRDDATQLAASLPGYDVQPIPAATHAEGILLDRTRLLIASMILLILLLTSLCVLATMAALAMERRKDVGLMKALGGSITRIVGLFLAEVGVLGASGGLIGCIVGMALARWMGKRVFGASITPRWEVFPITIVIMAAVALTGALPLQRLGRVKPALILRGD